jgi:phytoene dehydrogenase-like protein
LIVPAALAPIRSIPRSPVAFGRFAALGLLPATTLARRFATPEAKSLLAGVAAHSIQPLTHPLTGGFGLLFAVLAHSVGWPVVEGGSSAIADGLVAELTSLGGKVSTGRMIRRLDELPRARVILLDVTPRQLAALAGTALAGGYVRALDRFRYGPGVCKVDLALDGPVPWDARECRDTVTVHVGGTAAEIARGEAEVAAGRHPLHPFCIVVQPSVVDPSRAPEGKHTLYAYCHVPPGSQVDMSDRIEAQIERFAPGFRDLILARAVQTAAQMEKHNPNYVGGDVNSGAGTLRQTLLRPVPRWNPYRTPLAGVYLCSASTPPGGGVHGMCGVWAARTALADLGAS